MNGANEPGVGVPDGERAGLVGFRGRVVYKNGRAPEPFESGPAAVVAWERYAVRNGYELRGDNTPAVLMSMVVAFEALGLGPEGFDTWCRDVYGVELEAVNVPPTPPPVTGA